jgi:hypothetical protein
MQSSEIGPVGDQMDASALGPIAELCDGEVSYFVEGTGHYILMTGLRFMVEGIEHKMDALLCLKNVASGYPTKLYLPTKVRSGLNWNESPYIHGRAWETFSWSGVSGDQTPIEILAGHLDALTRKLG